MPDSPFGKEVRAICVVAVPKSCAASLLSRFNAACSADKISIEFAGRNGFNFVGLGPAAAVREHTDAYWRAWNAHRHEPGRLNGHVAAPKVGVLRLVVVADTDDEALAAAMRVVPLGAGVLAGGAVALLVLGYIAVYLLVFLPRGVVG